MVADDGNQRSVHSSHRRGQDFVVALDDDLEVGLHSPDVAGGDENRAVDRDGFRQFRVAVANRGIAIGHQARDRSQQHQADQHTRQAQRDSDACGVTLEYAFKHDDHLRRWER